MGCGGSTPADEENGGSGVDSAADLKSKQLEEELERQQQQENAIIKLLVLGTGESGKSTVFKQMKILCAPSTRPRSDAPAAPRARPAGAGRHPHRQPQLPASTPPAPSPP